jgi:ubiquinone biosynthesis UbiH/UbiF/VisC/COQ6 family hydroxylase
MDFDVLIAGAGPAGCTFASGLRGSGLKVGIIDPKRHGQLTSPAFDGREIALSQRTVDILSEFGIWPHVPECERFAINASKVIDGGTIAELNFKRPTFINRPLGRLVSNHLIQKAAYEAASEIKDVTLIEGHKAVSVMPGCQHSIVTLDSGAQLAAPLVVAADTRFSELRRQAGITASMHDFGQTMLVCRMTHEKPHHGTAWECFLYGATIAVLPLSPGQSSFILTLPQHKMSEWQEKSCGDFAADLERLLASRFGAMELASERITYPLVGVYSHRFVADGFALVGDAAVGMHPVTAHGYNFCVTGAHALSRRIRQAARNGRDFRSPALLNAYQLEHRARTRPLYEATRQLVQLYTDESRIARFARKAMLRAGIAAGPARTAIAGMLTRHAA